MVIFIYEAIVMVFLVCVFLNGRALSKLGFLRKKQLYLTVICVRLLGSILGMIAISTRNLKMTRILLSLFLLNAFASCVVLEPLLVAKCHCHGPPDTGFWQCRLVQQFGTFQHEFANPWPVSVAKVCSENRACPVPYNDPPKIQQARGEAASLLENVMTNTPTGKVKHLTKHKVHELDYHPSDPVVQTYLRSDGVIVRQHERKRILRSLHENTLSNKTALINLHAIQGEISLAATVNDFVVSAKSIQWARDQDSDRLKFKHCNNLELSVGKAAQGGEADLLQHLVKNPQTNTALQLNGHMRLCLSDPNCHAVSIDLSGSLQVCRLSGGIHPEPKPDDDSGSKTLYLQKKFSQAKNTFLKPGDSFRDLPKDQVFTALVEVFQDKCICDSAGCQVYKDKNTLSYWCWIDPQAVGHCRTRGIEIFKAGSDKFWSAELCTQSGCRCSGFGMPPNPGEVPDRSLDLWGNDANFGMNCQAWTRKANQRRWCYVGYDTTCADREQVPCQNCQASISAFLSTSAPAVRMYKSSVACQVNDPTIDQIAEFTNAKNRCFLFVWLAMIAFLLLCALAVPTGIMLFIFVENRCGDVVTQATDQFQAIDDYDDDDFEGNSDFHDTK